MRLKFWLDVLNQLVQRIMFCMIQKNWLINASEELSGRTQGSSLTSSQNGHQNNEDYSVSTKPTFPDSAIDNTRKLVKFQGIMRELYKGGSPWAPTVNALCANSSSDTDKFMLNRKDIFGFSARECRNCVSFEIIPQYFDTADKDGFHRVPHKCRKQAHSLYQNRKDMIITSKKLIEFWTEKNAGMYAVDISNYTGEPQVIKHPESKTKLIRVPINFDAAIYLDVEREAQEYKEKERKYWFYKVVGKKQIIPLKRNDLVKFLIKRNGSSYGIFRVPQTVSNCNAEHVGYSPQSKMYFIYIAKYHDITSRMVYGDCYYNHDYNSDASIMKEEEERQNNKQSENKLNVVQQPRTGNLLIAISLVIYFTGIIIHRRPKRNKEGEYKPLFPDSYYRRREYLLDGQVDEVRNDYWNFLLSTTPNNPISGIPPVLFTRGCYNYRDVQSLEDIRRRNLCGIMKDTPGIILLLEPLPHVMYWTTTKDSYGT